jgi:hypothetical protein
VKQLHSEVLRDVPADAGRIDPKFAEFFASSIDVFAVRICYIYLYLFSF